MKKRVVSAFLVLTVLLSLVVVPASALDYTGTNVDDFINDFTDKIFDLSPVQQDYLVDLMILYKELHMPNDFSAAYDEAIGKLLGNQGSEHIEGLNLTFELIREVAFLLNDDDFSPTVIQNLITTNSAENKQSFKDAFDLDGRKNEIKDVLDHADVTVTSDSLNFGFTEMKKFFNLLDTLSNDSNLSGFLKIFSAKSVRGRLTLRESKFRSLLKLAKVASFIKVDNPEEVIDAFQVLVAYYNSSNVNSGDNNLIYDYFDDNGFVYLDDDDDNNNNSGSTKPPVTPPVTEPDDTEAELDDVLADLIPEDPNQKPTAEEAKEMIEKAVELAEEVVAKAGTVDVTEQVVTTEDKAAADLSELDLEAQIKAAQETAAKLEEKLKEAGAEQKIETKVTFEVPETEGVAEVEVTLPPLAEVFKKVDKVKVNSQVAAFEFEKETFGEDNGNVVLSAAKVSEAVLEELMAKQPDSKKIPDNAVVIDLNAHIKKTDSEGKTTTEKVSNFKKKINVAFPYKLGENEDPEKVSVYLVKDDGAIVKVAGKYNKETGLVEFKRSTFSYYYVAPSTDTFNDLADYGWARQAIEVMAGKGVIAGRGNGMFDPGADIIRAEFAVLLTRILQLENDATEMPFTDIADNAWYKNDVAAAYKAGLVNGRSATMFDPKSNITRQEAAAMITNALVYLGQASEESADLISDKFTDFEAIAPYARNSVATLYREKIIKDLYEGEFTPKANATRAETAMMLYKLFLGY